MPKALLCVGYRRLAADSYYDFMTEEIEPLELVALAHGFRAGSRTD